MQNQKRLQIRAEQDKYEDEREYRRMQADPNRGRRRLDSGGRMQADPNRGRRRLDSGGQMQTEQVQADRTREMLNQAVSDVGPDIIL
ncbi:hypothetical protein Tco_1168586 [Tanacetum coccineum]